MAAAGACYVMQQTLGRAFLGLGEVRMAVKLFSDVSWWRGCLDWHNSRPCLSSVGDGEAARLVM